MIYGSVCSGIEAASVAWEPLGWRPRFFSEIEDFPSRVLAHRFPSVPNLGDFTQITRESAGGEIDVLVGGTPCQAFSVAGLRAGLRDPRGNLTLAFLRLVDLLRPRWVVWENVPGVLSMADDAFGSFVRGLADLGYGWAYRVLDAQHFGVPQRRRRVFVVGHSGGLAQRAAAVLFEWPSGDGDPPASGAPWARAAAGAQGGARGAVAHAVTAKWAKGTGGPAGDEAQNLLPIPSPPAVALPVAFGLDMLDANRESAETFDTLRARGDQRSCVAATGLVRRLTPRECERLQGFPDDWTAIPGAKDGPRYRALGNSMAVPVMRWIGRRMMMVEEVCGG